MQNLNNFDPIAFLKINTTGLDEKKIILLRTFLNTKIGEYILLDASGHLSDEQVKQISLEQDVQSILKRLREIIPNFDQYFISKLSDFKNDYQNIV